MTTPADDEEWSELTDFHPDRVDLVKAAANGTRFLIAKSDAPAGVLDPQFVRSLAGKSSPAPEEVSMPQTTLPNGINLSGSPAAIAAFIHKAGMRQAEDGDEVEKAEQSTKSQNDLPDSDFAYIESGGKKDADGKTTPRSLRHFPVNDAAHVRNALSRAPQSPFGDKAMPKIRARAKELGIEVSKEAGVPDTAVAKDAGDALDAATDDGVDGLDPTIPAAAPDGIDDVPGDPTDPGSGAWEAIDSATASKWCVILSGGKRAVQWLIDRESLEAVTVDPDDAENACDLSTVCDALDYAISQLAPYAVSEQSESDRLAFEADIQKSAAEPGSLPAAVVAIAKAGRVLSSANEGRIRQAASHLNDVLASLPQAVPDGGPAAVTKEEGAMPDTDKPADDVAKATAPAPGTAPAEDVTKEHPGTGTQMVATTLSADGTLSPPISNAPVAKASPVAILYDAAGDLLGVAPSEAVTNRVAKADAGDDAKPAMTAVFDADGNLIGICDPSAITPVAGAGKKAVHPAPEAKPEDAAAKPDGDAAAPEAPTPEAADAADLEPQPSADAGTPVGGADDDEDVAKGAQAPGTEENTQATDVLKSIAQLQELVSSSETARNEVVAKMAADNAELVKELGVMKQRLETVEAQPAAPGVFTNGATPPSGSRPVPSQLRGQDQGGAQQVDVAKARERKAELAAANGPEQARIAKEMTAEAVGMLAAMHAGH